MRLVYCLLASFACFGLTFNFDLQGGKPQERIWKAIGNITTCVITNLEITKRNERTMTSGNSIADIDQVKALSIRVQTVHFVPIFTKQIAQALEALSIYQSHLKTINLKDLQQFPNLRELHLRLNDIHSLDGNLFESTTKLEWINFRENFLISVGVNILKPLVLLKAANFIGADCIDKFANSTAELEALNEHFRKKCKLPVTLHMMEVTKFSEQNITDLEKQKSEIEKEIAELIESIAEEQKKSSDVNENLQTKTSEFEAIEKQQKEKIEQLENEVAEEKKKRSVAEKELEQCNLEHNKKNLDSKQKFYGCDQNLNTCIRQLAPLLSQSELMPSDDQPVDIICEKYSNEIKICEVKDFAISSSETKIGSVKEDKTGIVVRPTSLVVRNQSALFLPINFREAFPDLVELEVSDSGLFFIDQKTFKGLDKLANLNLTSNKLLRISRGSFADLKSLTTLDLSHNNVETIEAAAFQGLQSLKVLNLNDNNLKQVASKSMAPLKMLESLDLSGNSCADSKSPEKALKEVQDEIFLKCVMPINVTCTLSQDQNVCQVAFLRIEHPRIKIQKLKDSKGQTLKTINELIIEDQVVNFMPYQLGKTLPPLKKLVVLRSQLNSLAKTSFTGLNDLNWLDIRDNNITFLDAETFNAIQQLKFLDFSSNQVESLPAFIFQRLTMLEELRLSGNKITVLSTDVLPESNAIKIFRIANNKLQKIDSNILEIFKNSNEIDLSGNTCVDAKYQKINKNSAKTFNVLNKEVKDRCSAL